MFRKSLLILLALFAVVAVSLLLCGSQIAEGPNIPESPTSTPDIPRFLPTVEAEIQAAVIQGLHKIIPPDQPYYQRGGEKTLTVNALVSTGITETVSFPLENQTIQVDYLWAYDRTNSGVLTRLPVVFGLGYPDGSYEYFSDTLFFARQFEGLGTAISRTEALQDLQARLPRGRIFSLTFYQAVMPEKVIWKQCPETMKIREISGNVCALGEWMDQQYPEALRSFIKRTEKTIPQGWLLAGWYFAEANETFVRRDVILPEE